MNDLVPSLSLSIPYQAEPPKEDKDDKKRKRRTPTPAAVEILKAPPPKKKKKIQNSKSTTPTRSPSPFVPSVDPNSRQKPKKISLPELRRTGSGSSNEGLGCSEELMEDEEESECSAPQCLQPVADQISWVQCDRCEEWFHLMCVGLTKEYAEQIDTYICTSCRKPPPISTPPALTPLSSHTAGPGPGSGTAHRTSAQSAGPGAGNVHRTSALIQVLHKPG